MAREKMWSRIHLIPVMQAEEDRDQVRRMLADKAREKELLGGESQIYHGDRYVLLDSIKHIGKEEKEHLGAFGHLDMPQNLEQFDITELC